MDPARSRTSTQRQRRALHDEAVALIAAGCGEPLTLDAVAHAIATSRRQLQRAFAEVGHTTFSAHLTAARMDRAALLLLRTPASIGEVSRHVGYQDASQFTKAFKRRHGRTPSQLRAQAARRALGGQAA